MPQLLVNRFTVLKIEEYINNNSNIPNTPVYLSTISITLTKYSK